MIDANNEDVRSPNLWISGDAAGIASRINILIEIKIVDIAVMVLAILSADLMSLKNSSILDLNFFMCQVVYFWFFYKYKYRYIPTRDAR